MVFLCRMQLPSDPLSGATAGGSRAEHDSTAGTHGAAAILALLNIVLLPDRVLLLLVPLVSPARCSGQLKHPIWSMSITHRVLRLCAFRRCFHMVGVIQLTARVL